MQALKYLLYAFAMTVMGGRKEEASVVLSENGGVPAEELDALVLLEKSTNFYKPIGHNMTKFHKRQRWSLVLESGSNVRKVRTVRPKVGDLRPKVQQLDDTLRQSQCWAHENNRREWPPVRAEVGASKTIRGC